MRDCFRYSLFGLNMLPVRFHGFLRCQPFSRAQLRMLISRPSREHSFYNFRMRPLPIFVIWPKYATHVISRDFETATFFARPITHATTSNICFSAKICYPGDSARFRDGNLFRLAYRAHYYPGSLESALFIIFARDHFKYSLFGLNMLPV